MNSTLKLFFLILLSSFTYSCGKECLEQRNTLDTLDLKNLRPSGTYIYDDFLSKDKITFNADSTATIKYEENDTTYEFTYKVKTIGIHESTQKKF